MMIFCCRFFPFCMWCSLFVSSFFLLFWSFAFHYGFFVLLFPFSSACRSLFCLEVLLSFLFHPLVLPCSPTLWLIVLHCSFFLLGVALSFIHSLYPLHFVISILSQFFNFFCCFWGLAFLICPKFLPSINCNRLATSCFCCASFPSFVFFLSLFVVLL